MDAKRLAEIKARAEAATKGPWALMEDGFSRKPPNNCPTVYQTDTDLRYIAFFRDMNEWNQGEPTDNRANAEFCAHARQDIPDLIAEVERLRAALLEYDTRMGDLNLYMQREYGDHTLEPWLQDAGFKYGKLVDESRKAAEAAGEGK